MANPNVLNASSIYTSTTYLIPTGTSATTWTGLTPSTNSITKVDSIAATNVTATAATITLSINSAIGGGGTAYRLAYQMSVPAGSSLDLISKTIYLNEGDALQISASTNSYLEAVVRYEEIR